MTTLVVVLAVVLLVLLASFSLYTARRGRYLKGRDARIRGDLFPILEGALYRELKDFQETLSRNMEFRPAPGDFIALEQKVILDGILYENEGKYPFTLGMGSGVVHRLYRALNRLEMSPLEREKLAKTLRKMERKFDVMVELASG